MNAEHLKDAVRLILEKERTIPPDISTKSVVSKKNSYTQLANSRRKAELNSSGKITFNSKIVTRGFNIDCKSVVEETERYSPTKFEPRSPPLTIVKEETLLSTENLLSECSKENESSNTKTDPSTTKAPTTPDAPISPNAPTSTNAPLCPNAPISPNTPANSIPAIKTLDSLKLICNENKFPIKSREPATKTVK